jgi:hypothetical protein
MCAGITSSPSPVMREQLVEVARSLRLVPTKLSELVFEPGQENDVHASQTTRAIQPESLTPRTLMIALRVSHRCHAAEVPVSPRSRLGAVSDAGPDNMRSVETGLKRNVGDPEVLAVHHVADHKYLRVA